MVDKTALSPDEKVTQDLESAADAVFSGETIEGFEALAAPAETPAEPVVATAPEEKTEDADPSASAPAQEKEVGDPAAAPAAEIKSDEEKPAPAIEEQEIPVDIKGKTRERMETLISRVKETKTELQTTQEQLTAATNQVLEFKSMLDSTGLADTEIIQMLDIGTMLKTDPEKAFGVLQGVVKAMAKDLGKTIEPVDLLEGFPDLQDRVAKLDLSQKDAEALAKARLRETRETRIAAEQRQTRESAEQTTAKIKQAAMEVRDFLIEAQKDVDYPKIAPLLVSAAKFASENLDPTMWKKYIIDQHARIKEAAGTSRRQEVDPKSTPIVDVGAGGTKTRETKTLEDLADVLL